MILKALTLLLEGWEGFDCTKHLPPGSTINALVFRHYPAQTCQVTITREALGLPQACTRKGPPGFKREMGELGERREKVKQNVRGKTCTLVQVSPKLEEFPNLKEPCVRSFSTVWNNWIDTGRKETGLRSEVKKGETVQIISVHKEVFITWLPPPTDLPSPCTCWIWSKKSCTSP